MAGKKAAKATGPKMVTPEVPEGFVPMAYPNGKFFGNVPAGSVTLREGQGLVKLDEPPKVSAE